MKARLKRLSEQVVVITGATSGIGLVTARMAARRGARVVLVARNEPALRELVAELRAQHHPASYVVADVASAPAMREVLDEAIARHGTVDTWVNNAGVSVYGRLDEVGPADHRRLFETNFWGVVNGSIAALRHLKEHGGALINIGSSASEHPLPMQGMYSASKHAVKGFTDALRIELEAERAPVSVTLVMPAAIDTPYVEHARNYMPFETRNPPPVYAPELVAEAILHAAQRPVRELHVGGAAKALSALRYWAPRANDLLTRWFLFDAQNTGRPARAKSDSLHAPSEDLRERGGYAPRVLESSWYTSVRHLHAGRSLATVGAVALVAAAAVATVMVMRTGRRRSALRAQPTWTAIELARRWSIARQ